MKKLISLLLVLVMLLGMVACGNKTDEPANDTPQTNEPAEDNNEPRLPLRMKPPMSRSPRKWSALP